MVNILKQKKELEHLRNERNVVDSSITNAIRQKVVSHFQLNDLKKKKMMIKESISQLETVVLSDIVA